MSSGRCYRNRKEVETLRHHGWEREVREAIKESVPEPPEDGGTLESTSTRKVITKKKN